MVHERGARGGYTYQFSIGPDGQTWLIGSREDSTQWNVQVRVSSLCLALYGYEKTKQKLLYILDDDLKAKGPDENYGLPKERISRVDYCLDFALSEKFSPSYKNFVCHGRAKKNEIGNLPYNQISTGQGVETITVGKMPNRQVTIYNKIKANTAQHKNYWWDIWGIDKEKFDKEIWRIEIRAGKKELNKWNLKTFDHLEQIIGNVIEDILKGYKYTNKNKSDTNSKRWPTATIWLMATDAVKKDLFNYYSKTNSKIVLKKIREEMRQH